MAQHHEHCTHDVFRDGFFKRSARRLNLHAPTLASYHIDVVEADAQAADDNQLGTGVQQRRPNLGPVADNKATAILQPFV